MQALTSGMVLDSICGDHWHWENMNGKIDGELNDHSEHAFELERVAYFLDADHIIL